MTYNRETLYWKLVKKLRRLEDVLISALENPEKAEESEKELREEWKSAAELMASLAPEAYLAPEESIDPEEKDRQDTPEENADMETQFYALEDDDELQEEDPEVIPPVESKSFESLARSIGRRPKLSLNDKFLFSRELFGDDTKVLQQALDGIAEKGSYVEAEEYLIAAFNLNPEQESAQRFLAIVEDAFKVS